MFKEDANAKKKNPPPISLIVPHTHEILTLMDMIAQGNACGLQAAQAEAI